jgi:hypothetical protein
VSGAEDSEVVDAINHRVAILLAVPEIKRLGGCVDLDCRDPDCWLGCMADERRAVVRAVLEVTSWPRP